MKKKNYQTPGITMVALDPCDVITASSTLYSYEREGIGDQLDL